MGLMGFQVARRLFVVYQVVDGGVLAADGAGWSLLDFDGAELHGLGVERQQAVGAQPNSVRRCRSSTRQSG